MNFLTNDMRIIKDITRVATMADFNRGIKYNHFAGANIEQIEDGVVLVTHHDINRAIFVTGSVDSTTLFINNEYEYIVYRKSSKKS